MANYFNISGLNGFDWYLRDPILDPSYNTIPSEYDRRSYNPNGKYLQKWQTNDVPPIQLLSDFTPTLKFYICGTRTLYRNVDLPIIANSLIGVSFKSYQATVDFSDWDVGRYYGEITYIDENSNTITYNTSPFDLATKHPDTLKFEYTHSLNTLNILFQSPIDLTLQFRVEGWISLIDPESDTELYTDQEHNVTEEDSIPYFNYSLFIGSAKGVPDWVIKKMGLIFTCDQKKIDGIYYEKASADAKFTPTRPENTRNTDAYWAIPVIRNEDFFIEDLIIGDNPDENAIQVIVRAKEYLLNGGNIVLANTLKKATRLSYIQITNRDLTPFNVSVGITIGGSELGIYTLSGNITDTLAINKGFNSAATLYVTGLTGHNTDVWIEWHQLDDVTAIPTTGNGGWPKGFVGIYEELVPGDFELDWDVATGLGQAGRKYEGCALSGTNGTLDRSNMAVVGWDRSLPATRDTSIGDPDNSVTLTRANLPAEGLSVNGLTINTSYRTGDRSQRAAANDPTATLAKTENMGSGQAFDITPFSLYTVFFVKIVD